MTLELMLAHLLFFCGEESPSSSHLSLLHVFILGQNAETETRAFHRLTTLLLCMVHRNWNWCYSRGSLSFASGLMTTTTTLIKLRCQGCSLPWVTSFVTFSNLAVWLPESQSLDAIHGWRMANSKMANNAVAGSDYLIVLAPYATRGECYRYSSSNLRAHPLY